MMPTPRCMRLAKRRPAVPMIFMCCRLPCAQRRSRMATSMSEGGDSSQDPPQSVAMRTFQPPRRISAASTKSCDSTKPPKGLRPSSFGRPQFSANAAHADDGVVAPVVAAVARPGGQAARDDRAVDAGGELLQAAEEGRRADQLRSGLQYPELRIGLHRQHQLAAAWAHRSSCRRRARSCDRSGRPSASRSPRGCRICARCSASAAGTRPA